MGGMIPTRTFDLRIPTSLRIEADQAAQEAGVSLAQFIDEAISAKVVRTERDYDGTNEKEV
jgi:predicted HicB family RNase H-like nuclease